MRRISPATLRRCRLSTLLLPSPRPRQTDIPLRPLSSSIISRLPRSGSRARSDVSISETPDIEEDKPFEEAADPDDDPPSPLPPFEDFVISIIPPGPIESSLPDHLRLIHHHLLTSFLPKNQPCRTTSPRSEMPAMQPPFGLPGGSSMMQTHTAEDDPPILEPVLALVSPFEGGRHYVTEAVKQVASQMDADIVRFDLALGLGMTGPAAPLGESLGVSAPQLPSSVNPMLQNPPSPPSSPPAFSPNPAIEDDANEEGDDEPDNRGSAIVLAPWPGRPMGMPFGGAMDSSNRYMEPINDEWVNFFTSIISVEGPGADASERKRIILLESPEAMSATFDVWWPSFVEAVRRRRVGEQGSGDQAKEIVNPTTVIFSSSPSLLRSHTAPAASKPSQAENAIQAMHPMLQELADRFGGTVETKVENVDASPLWWGSEEVDGIGREQRNEKRLSVLLEENKGPAALLPIFGSAGRDARKPSRHPLLDMLSQQAGRRSPSEENVVANSLVTKTLAVVPDKRDQHKELLERMATRSLLSAALMARAVHQAGGDLVDPVSAAYYLEVEPFKSKRRTGKRRDPTTMRLLSDASTAENQIRKLFDGNSYRLTRNAWQNVVKAWSDIQQLATATLGRKLAEGDAVRVTWHDVLQTSKIERSELDELRNLVNRHLTRKPTSANPLEDKRKLGGATVEPVVDSVVSRVKKAKDLSNHEKRLLSCIVDTSKISSTTFNDVHLPFKTIDAIRTIISLPLLFPEAFQGGVLKDHSTTGAMLFGPPGTGKTLLARAVANESGARMLAIQPSDVNDKYFGEGEKLVKAVFSLARRLSPCVVFLDEVDALFGARSSKGSGFGNKAHDQLLTEFMQEMDGLSSADANREKRIVVVGATNRPFDLDDAVLRRLPRRLLVDLPGVEDRQSILKILLRGEALAEDVDLERIAKETDGYSGSDLKHLCVSAALSAVKDMVAIPWKKSADDTATVRAVPTTPHSGPSRLDEPVLIPTVPEATQKDAIPATAATLEEDIRAQINAEKSDPEELGTGNAEHTPLAEDSEKGEGSAAARQSDSGPSSSLSSSSVRTLHRKHFDTALSEIRPSSSEEGTLPELRKWAEQFGEGGSQRGRKKGFGKGFGFGDAVKGDRDKGYGKVGQEE